MELRKYQKDALQAVVDNLKLGVRQQLLVLATGLGKTVLAAQLPSVLKEVLPGKMLFVAHRNELLTQAIDKIRLWNPELKVGLEKAESHAAPDSDVIVACNASIGRQGSTRMDHFWDDISVIVIDECHHILGGSYMNLLEDSGVLKADSKKLLIGLTATPKRRNVFRDKTAQTTLDDGDLISLKSVFSKITFSYPIRRGIKEGFLVPLKGFRVSTNTSLDEVKSVAGDFQVDQLSKTVNTPERNLQIVKAWKEYAHNRPTVCFTVDVQHARDLSETFLHNGVLAQPIWGDDPQRADKLKWHEMGKVTVLCNCALLTEGYDSPSLSCIVLSRPTKSSALMTQQVGRGTRLCEGKEDCIIIDVCDNTKRNSLITFPSLLGLNPDMNLKGGDVVKVAEEVEALQEKYPAIPMAGLTDMAKVKAYIESIDIFAAPYSEEVNEFSTMKWMGTKDGEYVLPIPEKKDLSDKKAFARYLHEKLHLRQNELEEWVLSLSSTTGERELGIFNDLQEAFATADDVIQRCRLDRVKLMLRETPSGKLPASEAAKKYLRRLSKNRPVFKCLCDKEGTRDAVCAVCNKPMGITSGEASYAISRLHHT